MRQNRILQQKNNLLTLNLADLLRNLDPSKNHKYFNILTKHVLGRFQNDKGYLEYLRGEFAEKRGITHLFDSLDTTTTIYYARLLEMLFNEDDLKILTKFHDYCERGLIKNCDTHQFNDLFELEKIISVVDLKFIDKQLEKETIKVFECGDWLLVRPLTHAAAVKYGYGTRWCTSMTKTYEHFERYSNRGILIYIINFKTGDKVAFFHNINKDWDKETSFWNAVDMRVDSIEIDLPKDILNFLKSVIDDEDKVSNMSLMSSELKAREYEYYEKYYENKNDMQDIPVAETVEEVPLIVRNNYYLRPEINVD